jgi:hypothetical protein
MTLETSKVRAFQNTQSLRVVEFPESSLKKFVCLFA